MKPSIRFGIFLLLVVALGFHACNDSDRDEDDETVASHDNALAESLIFDMVRQVHRVAVRDTLINDTGLVQDIDNCMDSAVVSDTLAIFPLDLTLYYGKTARLCEDGRRRRGTIRATFTGKLKSSFTKITIEPINYAVDDILVEGKIVMENTGFNDQGNRQYAVQVTEGALSAREISVDWVSTTAWEWVNGAATDDEIDDDVWMIFAGGASGRNTKGNTFVSTIQTPQRYESSCNWFTQGVLRVEVPNLATRTVDYGSGACDNDITVTRDATTFNVTIE